MVLTTVTAPELIVFDTNWLIHNLGDAKCLAADIAGRRPATSILIPKEVLRELDRLKTAGRDEATRYNVSQISCGRFFVFVFLFGSDFLFCCDWLGFFVS